MAITLQIANEQNAQVYDERRTDSLWWDTVVLLGAVWVVVGWVWFGRKPNEDVPAEQSPVSVA